MTVEAANRSAATWPVDRGARVRLAYRWVDVAGVEVEGQRTELVHAVEPNEWLEQEQFIEAPPLPGHYTLVLDPVFEWVGWFSDHPGVDPYRLEVEVVEAVSTASNPLVDIP